MNVTLAGALKSKTIWTAGVLALLSNIAPLIPAVCAMLKLDPATIQLIGSLAAALMAVLRGMTTESLADKGAEPPTLGKPPAVTPSLLLAFIAIATLPLLHGCSIFASKPLSFDESLATAYVAHTAVVNATTEAVISHTLTSDQAQKVATMAAASRSLLDEAKAIETAGNAPGAASELQLAMTSLTALKNFLNSAQGAK